MPVKLKSSATIVTFGKKKVSETFLKFLEKEMRLAARAWLRAVLLNIPKYTGTTRGTFKPLGRVLRVSLNTFAGPSGGSKERAKAKLRRGFTTVNGITVPLGEAAGAAFAEHKLGRVGFNKVVFEYTNLLPWFAINEFTSGPPNFRFATPPPWQATKAGDAAFLDYVNNIMFKKKEMKDILSPTVIRKIG